MQPSQIRWSSFINRDSTSTDDLWPPLRPQQLDRAMHQHTSSPSGSNCTSDWESISTFTGQQPPSQQPLVRDSIRSLKAFVEREIGMSALRTSEAVSESATLVESPPSKDSPQSVSPESVSYTHLAKAKYSYHANFDDANEVSFRRNEVLQVEATSDLWWMIKKANGETGIAPSTFLALLPEAEFSADAEYNNNAYSISSRFGSLLGSAAKFRQRIKDTDKLKMMVKGLSSKVKRLKHGHQVAQDALYEET